MTPARWQQVKEIFGSALQLGEGSWRTYVATACAQDTVLRREVESLLAAHDHAAGFIEVPAAQQVDCTPPPAAPGSGAQWIGRRLGVYRIIETIGRGGMSEVHKAVRDDNEYHQEVAIKLLRCDYDLESLMRRFRVERQILASLNHPNIAHLIDGGVTAEGVPYLVMEHVKGRPIDVYCDEQGLDITARLRLFRTLCAAVQYVHQHLMVHGDLKCHNVLVTDDGVVKLLDFGVARLLSSAPGLPPDARLTGLLALTPAYASPEQIRGEPVTTASDVYSLGVLLYRLLSGQLPHSDAGIPSYELAARICEGVPRKPSDAALQSSLPGKWRRRLLGDLDDIVLFALRREPSQRYTSVEQLSMDVARHLGGFPVMASGTSTAYRLRKFIGRNARGVAATILFALALVVGTVTTANQARIAWAERQRAERHLNDVRKLADTFMFEVHDAIENLPGATSARQLLVENSLKYLDGLAREEPENPVLQSDLAAAYERVGDVQGKFLTANLGDAPGALRSYHKALALREQLLGRNAADNSLRRSLLRNLGKLSDLSFQLGDTTAALEYSRRTVELARALAESEHATADDRRNLANAWIGLGLQLGKSGNADEGIRTLRRGVTIYEQLVAADAEDQRSLRALAIAYSRIGVVLAQSADQHTATFDVYAKALQIAEQMIHTDGNNVGLRKIAGYALLGMGGALAQQRDLVGALDHQQRALRLFESLLAADGANEDARADVAYARSRLSETLLALGGSSAAGRTPS